MWNFIWVNGVLILNFEHISHLVLSFLLLTLNRQRSIESFHVLEKFQVPRYFLCVLSNIMTTSIRTPSSNWCFGYIYICYALVFLETYDVATTSIRRLCKVKQTPKPRRTSTGRGLNFLPSAKFTQTFVVYTQV